MPAHWNQNLWRELGRNGKGREAVNYKIGFRLAVVAWAVSVIAVLTWAVSTKRPIEEITYTTEVVEVIETTAVYEPWTVDQEDAEMLARLAWCEGRGCTTTNQAAVMWCVLNRVDDPRFPDSIQDVILAPGQFYYLSWAPVTDDLLALAQDVLARWRMEDMLVDAGRVLPSEYVYFAGNGVENIFRTAYRGGEFWDWSWGSPYADNHH